MKNLKTKAGLLITTLLFVFHLSSQIPYSINVDEYTGDTSITPHEYMNVETKNGNFDCTMDIIKSKGQNLIYAMICYIAGPDTIHGKDKITITFSDNSKFTLYEPKSIHPYIGYYYFAVSIEFIKKTEKEEIKRIEIENGYMKKKYASTSISDKAYFQKFYASIK